MGKLKKIKKMLLFVMDFQKKSAKVQQIKESDYGYYEEGKVAVNIEKIAKKMKNEEKFVKTFSQVMLHETLHMLLEDEVGDDFIVGEEKIIRKICGEPWSKKLEEQYEQDALNAA